MKLVKFKNKDYPDGDSFSKSVFLTWQQSCNNVIYSLNANEIF